jgi:hypothetical protein
LNNTKVKNILFVVFFSYAIIAIIVVFKSPQYLVWDPALTLKMTDNGYKHIPFNHYQHPKPLNLNEDETEFVTWWTPGQYALPMVLEKAFNIKLNIALKILITLCLFFSALGMYKLYYQLIEKETKTGSKNNSPPIAILYLLTFTFFQPFFWSNLLIYDGGGILMLAYCPWFIYWIIKRDRLTFFNLAVLLLLSAVGFFLKAAFTSVFGGALLYLFLSTAVLPFTGFKNINIKKLFINGLCLCIVFVIYIIATKTLFLNHNTNISNSSQGLMIQPRVLAFPVVAPFFGFFSLSMLNKTIYWLIGMVIVLPVYYLMFKSRTISTLYKIVLLSFVGVGVCFYTLIYFMGVDVSYEYRHFIILTVLLTPALFIVFWRGRLAKLLVIGIAVIYTIFNAVDYIKSINFF